MNSLLQAVKTINNLLKIMYVCLCVCMYTVSRGDFKQTKESFLDMNISPRSTLY